MFRHQLTRFALRIKCNDLRAQHKAKPKSIANRAATFTAEEFWNDKFLLPCSPWGPRGFHGAAQSTPSRFLFLSRVNFEISPSFSSLLPLSQQHCLGPEKKTYYSKKKFYSIGQIKFTCREEIFYSWKLHFAFCVSKCICAAFYYKSFVCWPLNWIICSRIQSLQFSRFCFMTQW